MELSYYIGEYLFYQAKLGFEKRLLPKMKMENQYKWRYLLKNSNYPITSLMERVVDGGFQMDLSSIHPLIGIGPFNMTMGTN